MVVNYANGKIYRIVCNISGKQYIGSTTQSLSMRLAGHKKQYNLYLNNKSKYLTSFEILKNNSYKIILVENVICENKEQLLKKEREYIESTECVNKVIPLRTLQEYYQDNLNKIQQYRLNNKDHIKKICKKYREKNKNEIKDKQKVYRQNNSEKIKQARDKYYQNNRNALNLKTRKYYENNKSKIKEQNKIYRDKNKEKQKEYQKQYSKDYKGKNKEKIKNDNKEYYERIKNKLTEKHNCPCGSCIQKREIRNHEKSKKHLAYLESLKETK